MHMSPLTDRIMKMRKGEMFEYFQGDLASARFINEAIDNMANALAALAKERVVTLVQRKVKPFVYSYRFVKL